uniref:Uncharacterized protein n=1 Tax=Oryza meridionalis TaxID=40149 RepID=A0A0E0ETT2_9ORYZ
MRGRGEKDARETSPETAAARRAARRWPRVVVEEDGERRKEEDWKSYDLNPAIGCFFNGWMVMTALLDL